MLNKTIMMGRLTRDPEIRRTQAGIPVATFSLAVERDFTDRSTGRKAVDFPKVEAWRQTAEIIEKWFAKGQMICVEGRMESREWSDKDGKKKVEWVVAADRVYFAGEKKDGDAPKSGSDGDGGELAKLRAALEKTSRELTTLRRDFATFAAADRDGVSTADESANRSKTESYREAFKRAVGG